MPPFEYLNFDALYKSICEDLSLSKRTEDVLSHLKRAKSDYERVKIFLEDNNNVPQLFENNIKDHYESKSEVKASAYFSKGKLDNSLSALNKALLYCPNFSIAKTLSVNVKELAEFRLSLQDSHDNSSSSSSEVKASAILYHRSVILHENELYEDCIKDIFACVHVGGEKSFDKVFLLGQCFSKLYQLDEAKNAYEYSLNLLRQSNLDNEWKSKETIKIVKSIKELSTLQCQPQRTQNEKVLNNSNHKRDEQYFKLFAGSNEHISGTSSAVTLKFLEDRGRHMLAVKRIPPGSTLIIEHPYVWSLTPSEYESLCQFCVKPSLSPIPCKTCSSVIFCSHECYWKAYEFHELECKILKLLDSSEKLGKMGLLCFRTISKTPIEAVREEVFRWNENNLSEGTIFGYNDKGILDSSNYSSVYAQTPNSGERNAGDLFKRACAAIYLTMCLKYTGYFKNQSKLNNTAGKLSSDEIIVASALLRHLQSVSCNAYGINLISKGTKNLEIEEVGGATNPVISTTNHSCNPNVYRINIGNICVVKSLREISEGDEILDSYGPQFTTMSLEERMEELQRQYLFTCSCTACVENWGCFKDLKIAKNIWKCPLVECPGGYLEDKAGNKRKCMKCGVTSDLKRLQTILKPLEEKYLKTKDLVLKEKCDSKEIEKVFKYISTVQKLMKSPCMEVVEAQEMLKLYWNLKIKNSG